MVMKKIASPQDLQAELRSLMAYVHGFGPKGKPDRQVVAAKLLDLANRVAARRTPRRTPDELYQEAEAAYKRGRKALMDGNLEAARVQAIRIGEWVLKAKNAGLEKRKLELALKAMDALLNEYHRAWSRLKLPK